MGEQLWILNESAGTHTPLHLVQLQLRPEILVDVAMAVGKKGFSKEDELLLQDFSKNVSTKSSALFYGNAFIVSAIPVWLFWRVHSMEPVSSAPLFAAVTLVSTWLVAFAYRNTKHLLKHQVAVKREAAVTKEMSKQLNDDKKISRKEKNEVAEYEATTFAIFYNNALFLSILVFASFYVLKTLGATLNYIVSMAVAAGVIALISTRSSA